MKEFNLDAALNGEHWRFLDKFPTVPISPREYINSKALFKDAFNYYNKTLNLRLEEIK